MICVLEGLETGKRAAAGTDGGTGTCRGRSGELLGARGDGCRLRRPSGSAAAEPLGLTAGPEPPRPHDPPPRARPIKSAPTPLRLRRWLLAHIPGGWRLSSLPGTRRRRRQRGDGGKGGRKTGSGSKRRGPEKEEAPQEPEPPLPEPQFAIRGGSQSIFPLFSLLNSAGGCPMGNRTLQTGHSRDPSELPNGVGRGRAGLKVTEIKVGVPGEKEEHGPGLICVGSTLKVHRKGTRAVTCGSLGAVPES
ncbi:uncharacterized protein LOC144581623 [Callithrix jacchus]